MWRPFLVNHNKCHEPTHASVSITSAPGHGVSQILVEFHFLMWIPFCNGDSVFIVVFTVNGGFYYECRIFGTLVVLSSVTSISQWARDHLTLSACDIRSYKLYWLAIHLFHGWEGGQHLRHWAWCVPDELAPYDAVLIGCGIWVRMSDESQMCSSQTCMGTALIRCLWPLRPTRMHGILAKCPIVWFWWPLGVCGLQCCSADVTLSCPGKSTSIYCKDKIFHWAYLIFKKKS